MGRRAFAAVVACAACTGAFATPALANGTTWLDWAYEPAGAGIHGSDYTYWLQGAAEVKKSGNWSCTNGWLGSKGAWVFGNDYCAPANQEAATPKLSCPGHTAYAWAQSEYYSDYLWAWVGYGGC